MKLSPLVNLHYSDYEHPLDAKSLNMLEGTPGLERMVKAFIKHGIERLIIISYTGSNLRVTPRNFPALYTLFEDVCARVNLHRLPHLYIEGNDSINSFTIGDEEPVVVITSGAIDRLTDPELRFLFGHEAGHIKSRHTRYHMMAKSVTFFGEMVGDLTLGLGKILTTPVQISLNRWNRMSELTADRLGLLACQSLQTVASVFSKMAGLPQKFEETPAIIDEFLQQAKEFELLDMDKVTRWVKLTANVMQTHPWTVLRTTELTHWIDSGKYDDLLKRAFTEKTAQPVKELPPLKTHCDHCGSKIEKTEAFCGNCGKPLS